MSDSRRDARTTKHKPSDRVGSDVTAAMQQVQFVQQGPITVPSQYPYGDANNGQPNERK